MRTRSAKPQLFMRLPFIQLTLSLLVATVSVASQGAERGLFDYLVFAKTSIDATNSDYLGDTGAGGDVRLRGFLIDGNLRSAGTIELTDGSVTGLAEAARLRFIRAGATRSRRSTSYLLEARRLSAEMDELSLRLAELAPTDSVVHTKEAIFVKAIGEGQITTVELSTENLSSGTDLYIQGSKDDVVVVNVWGPSVVIENTGFFLSGGIGPERILLHFPSATSLRLLNSGAPYDRAGRSLGVPASILAPRADFAFASALVTGNVFVKSIQGIQGLPSGQINNSCFKGGALGVGCGIPVPPPAPAP